MAKYLLIVAIVLIAATAGVGVMNRNTLVETKENLHQTETKLGATQKNLSETTKKLNDTTETLANTEKEKTNLAAELNSTQSELSSTKGQLDDATKAGEEKDATIAKLEEDIRVAKQAGGNSGGDGEKDLSKVIADLQQKISESEASIASLQEKNKSDLATIDAYKQKEDERKKHIAKQGLEGRVLAVNPAWNFVVLSIGDKQGVINNSEMLLKRGGQYLGKVRITSVEPSTSIADIVANTLPSGVAVQPGDSVIYQSTVAPE